MQKPIPLFWNLLPYFKSHLASNQSYMHMCIIPYHYIPTNLYLTGDLFCFFFSLKIVARTDADYHLQIKGLSRVGLSPLEIGPMGLYPVGIGPVELDPVWLGPVGLCPVGLGPIWLDPEGLDIVGLDPVG